MNLVGPVTGEENISHICVISSYGQVSEAVQNFYMIFLMVLGSVDNWIIDFKIAYSMFAFEWNFDFANKSGSQSNKRPYAYHYEMQIESLNVIERI